MSNNNEIILVTGATGQQGGATTRHLLANGWKVRALTRDLNKPSAQALADAGVELVQGDFDDLPALTRAFDGVYGAFSVQLPFDFDTEVRQGTAVADAARAAGVQHFVYSSVGGAERNTGIPHFDSKWEIEKHVRALGLPATILRPTYFMNNVAFQRDAILQGTMTSMGINPDKPLQMIAANDIGAFAAMAFNNPDDYISKAIEIAGDEMTEPQMAATISDVIGRPVQLFQPESPSPYKDMVVMVEWFNTDGYEADIPSLRQQKPELMNFKTWLSSNNWN